MNPRQITDNNNGIINNGIIEKSLAGLKDFVQGKWSAWPFECCGVKIVYKENTPGYFYSDGQEHLIDDYYYFIKSGKFVAHPKKGGKSNHRYAKDGTWELRRDNDKTYLGLTYRNA